MSDGIKPLLLPCPFCEGEVDLLSSGQIAWTRCPSCRAEGPISKRGKDGAAAAWNRRVPAPAVPDDVAGLVAELRVIGCHENGDARCTCGIGMDAADALEAQAAELAQTKADNARLRGALTELCEACSGLDIKRGDTALAAARAALTQPTGDRT